MATASSQWDHTPQDPREPWPVPPGEWGRPARLAPPAPPTLPASPATATTAPTEVPCVHEGEHASPSLSGPQPRSWTRTRLFAALAELTLVCLALLAAWLAPLARAPVATTPFLGSGKGPDLRLEQTAANLAGEAQMLASDNLRPSAAAVEALKAGLEAARRLPPPPSSAAAASWYKALGLISSSLEGQDDSGTKSLGLVQRQELLQAAVLLTALARPDNP